jgi:hypothetical protein
MSCSPESMDGAVLDCLARQARSARIALWKPLPSSLARSRQAAKWSVVGGWLLARSSRQRRARSSGRALASRSSGRSQETLADPRVFS